MGTGLMKYQVECVLQLRIIKNIINGDLNKDRG